MTKKPYDYVVFIGRFQPFHNGHKEVIKKALELTDNLIVLIGSSNVSRSIRNPFTFKERKALIQKCFSNNIFKAILPLNDYPYNDSRWIVEVTSKVYDVIEKPPSKVKIALIGHTKEDTEYYLSLFPSFDYVEVPETINLNATEIRTQYFKEGTVNNSIPDYVKHFLTIFKNSSYYVSLKEDFDYIEKYKKDWEAAPYAPTFVTVDSVVIQSGHILLIERGGYPGKGLLALPGGFLDPNEFMLDGAIRELREETKLKVPSPVLRGSLVKSQVFDHPLRSSRGRTITQAFYFKLKDMPEGLSKVSGGDDARKAAWYPLASIDPCQMFEDHYAIIQQLTNI